MQSAIAIRAVTASAALGPFTGVALLSLFSMAERLPVAWVIDSAARFSSMLSITLALGFAALVAFALAPAWLHLTRGETAAETVLFGGKKLSGAPMWPYLRANWPTVSLFFAGLAALFISTDAAEYSPSIVFFSVASLVSAILGILLIRDALAKYEAGDQPRCGVPGLLLLLAHQNLLSALPLSAALAATFSYFVENKLDSRLEQSAFAAAMLTLVFLHILCFGRSDWKAKNIVIVALLALLASLVALGPIKIAQSVLSTLRMGGGYDARLHGHANPPRELCDQPIAGSEKCHRSKVLKILLLGSDSLYVRDPETKTLFIIPRDPEASIQLVKPGVAGTDSPRTASPSGG